MDDTRFFSVTGFMKSGTNWLGGLLSTHPDIKVIGEFHWQQVYKAQVASFNKLPIYHDDGFQDYVMEQLDRVVKNSLKAHCWPPPKIIGERTPRMITPLIMRDSPVVTIIRDGRDVLVSRAYHLFNEPGVHKLFQRVKTMQKDLERFQKNPVYFKKNPERLLCHEVMVRESIQWWVEHQRSDRRAIEDNPDLEVHLVHYEDLHRDVEGERLKMFEFLEVDPAEAEPIEGPLMPGFARERPDKFLRKGAVGDWENYFNDETKSIFNEIAGEELIRLGYVDSLNW